LLDVLNDLKEDLEAMATSGDIVDYEVTLIGEDPVIVVLNEECESHGH